jgi:hypothetical protein
MATQQTVAKALTIWAANWPSRPVQSETVHLYEVALADVPDATLERAAIECLRGCTFWPTVAEVRAHCEIPVHGVSIAEAESAILAAHSEYADALTLSRAWLDLERRRRAWFEQEAAWQAKKERFLLEAQDTSCTALAIEEA